jgi:hypothetical protein
MEPDKESLFAKLNANAPVIQVILGVIAIIVAIAVPWYYAQSRVEVTEAPEPFATPPSETAAPTPVPSPSASPAETVTSQETVAESPSAPPHRDPPFLPLEFTLHDGDQKTFLGDQASVAAEFNQIGSQHFVTLKVGTTEGEPAPYPVLGAGARFFVRVAGNDYSVYVLSVDKTARTVEVRISRNSGSQ